MGGVHLRIRGPAGGGATTVAALLYATLIDRSSGAEPRLTCYADPPSLRAASALCRRVLAASDGPVAPGPERYTVRYELAGTGGWLRRTVGGEGVVLSVDSGGAADPDPRPSDSWVRDRDVSLELVVRDGRRPLLPPTPSGPSDRDPSVRARSRSARAGSVRLAGIVTKWDVREPDPPGSPPASWPAPDALDSRLRLFAALRGGPGADAVSPEVVFLSGRGRPGGAGDAAEPSHIYRELVAPFARPEYLALLAWIAKAADG